MAYTKQEWRDGPDGDTPLSAARLNHIEEGIADKAAQGPKGTKGDKGDPGPQGPSGADGAPTVEEWAALVARVDALEAGS